MFGENEVDFTMRDVFVVSLSSLRVESVKIECFPIDEISKIAK